jgi:hypothetical protein
MIDSTVCVECALCYAVKLRLFLSWSAVDERLALPSVSQIDTHAKTNHAHLLAHCAVNRYQPYTQQAVQYPNNDTAH